MLILKQVAIIIHDNGYEQAFRADTRNTVTFLGLYDWFYVNIIWLNIFDWNFNKLYLFISFFDKTVVTPLKI